MTATSLATLEVEGGVPDETMVQPGDRSRLVSNVLINLAAVLERMEEQILPAVYAFLGASFNATPSQLGVLTLCRALTQAVSAPLGGISGHYLHRGRCLGVGCLLWASTTALFSLTTSLHVGMGVWALNGIGLALVIPTTQSLTADYFPASSRGRAFGTLWLTAALGGMAGALFATNLGAHRPLGIEGWRVAFLLVAAISALVGALNWVLTQDPRRPPADKHGGSSSSSSLAPGKPPSFGALCREVLSVIKVPTFGIIVAQGIAGSVPWSAMAFLTLYLQLLGMSDAAASGLVALFLGGVALGGLLGGWVGDRAAARWPSHGRIAATQFSVASGIPFSLVLLKGLPQDGSRGTVVLYGALLLGFGLVKAWPAPCCNNPIFAEVVLPQHRTLIYAFDRCFEGAIAACAAPLVGLLAQKLFGFTGSGAVTNRREQDLANARALGNALLAFLLVPWCICFILYSGLHFTYPKDRKAAQKHHHGGGGSVRLHGAAPPPAGLQEGGVEQDERQPLRLPTSGVGAGEEEEQGLLEFEVDPAELQRLFPTAECWRQGTTAAS